LPCGGSKANISRLVIYPKGQNNSMLVCSYPVVKQLDVDWPRLPSVKVEKKIFESLKTLY